KKIRNKIKNKGFLFIMITPKFIVVKNKEKSFLYISLPQSIYSKRKKKSPKYIVGDFYIIRYLRLSSIMFLFAIISSSVCLPWACCAKTIYAPLSMASFKFTSFESVSIASTLSGASLIDVTR